ncbi:hypothetical protein [uncultured Draconibacterium sp.]|uniref:hypothetical protein n=1 Tax=uncultured Draconibacterium sp. TaxID=1573823 RepID=UPI00326167C1
MSEIDKHITIPKNVSTENDLDYHWLRQRGQEYIEQLAGNVWTDYNSHDPGITILELLCYAITDLGARISMPLENLLAPADQTTSLKEQFFDATEILPSKPVTEADYRKLFIDIDGVKNCWLQPFNKTVFANLKHKQLSYDEGDFDAIDADDKTSFMLNGLYKLIVDFDEPNEDKFPGTGDKKGEIERIKNEIFAIYHRNRNLCEDLVKIEEVQTHAIAVCANIEVEPDANEEMVHARVLEAIDNYFSPDITYYSLQQMLNKGYGTEQIFEGPLLQNGFIDTVELENAKLREQVRLSDIMQLIMAIDGVKVIHEISIKDCKNASDENNEWLICVEQGKKPKLCADSAFSYKKGVLPLNVNSLLVRKFRQEIRAAKLEANQAAKADRHLKIPTGTFTDVKKTTSIQNHFPEVYGIGESGLTSQATVKRKVQAKQLQGYLLFFDQVLASYFAHLNQVKNLLAVDNSLATTYFTQVVTDVLDFSDLVNDYPANDEELTRKILAGLDDNINRKNQILDHLLGRFAEKFTDYAFLMKQLYGSYADRAVVNAKQNFLLEYGEKANGNQILNKGISNWRGSAFNYYHQSPEHLWDTHNVSGLQKRVARLCGIKDFSRRNLSESYVEIYELTNVDGKDVFRWHINNQNGIHILSATEDYPAPRYAEEELYQAVVKILETTPEEIIAGFEKELTDQLVIGNFEVQLSDQGKYSFNIINLNANPESTDRIIARQFIYYNSPPDLKEAMLDIQRFLSKDFAEEGMFIIEHILLRPDVTSLHGLTKQFMPICFKKDEDCMPIDPYSYRVTVVLPGWTYRFANVDFRNFMEEQIRRELPAHVLARICWIGNRKDKVKEEDNDMLKLENAWKTFLLKKTNLNQAQDKLSLHELIKVISELTTIYPAGRLIDCDEEEDKTGGRIVLGRTNIGNL